MIRFESDRHHAGTEQGDGSGNPSQDQHGPGQDTPFIVVRVKRSYVDRWLEENDRGHPFARWAAGLLDGSRRFWFDGSPCVLLEDRF